MYQRIVSADVYDIVRNKTKANKYGKRSTEVIYLLRHKLTCGYCCEPISAECGTTSTGQNVDITNVLEGKDTIVAKSQW